MPSSPQDTRSSLLSTLKVECTHQHATKLLEASCMYV